MKNNQSYIIEKAIYDSNKNILIRCPHCTNWEAQPVDQQLHHLQSFATIEIDGKAKDNLHPLLCHECQKIHLLNRDEPTDPLEFILQLAQDKIDDLKEGVEDGTYEEGQQIIDIYDRIVGKVKKPKVAIFMDGGLIQWICTNNVDIDIQVLDGDVEGIDLENLSTVKNTYGKQVEFYFASPDILKDEEYVDYLMNLE